MEPCKTILVVDDTPTERKLLRANFEAEGLTVLEANDGLEALSILREQSVDAVLSDILMPRMDGFRLCHAIRHDEQLKRVRFIFYTSSYTSESDEKLASNVGADKFLRKPAPVNEILEALNEVCQHTVARPVETALDTEPLVMKEYSEALITRLERKNVQLKQTREELSRANADLERRVRERTLELEAANRELEAFSHSVAHDLRNPIRTIEGFTAILLNECNDTMPPDCIEYLNRVVATTHRMHQLIENLLRLGKATSSEFHKQTVNLSEIVSALVGHLRLADVGRRVQVNITPDLNAEADPDLILIALENLLNNAWKFTKEKPNGKIEFGREGENFFVRDNGVGFDMSQADKLFTAFQRLHSAQEFPGTGIGLATVQRIIHRHGGRIWAESFADRGTTFYFTLGTTDKP